MDGMVGGGIYLSPMREDLILEWGESPTSPNFHTAFSTSIVLVRFSLQFRLPTLPKSSPFSRRLQPSFPHTPTPTPSLSSHFATVSIAYPPTDDIALNLSR